MGMRAILFRAATVVVLAAGAARAAVPVEAVTSPGGIRAWLVEDHSQRFTALEIRFRGGTNLDPPGQRGVVNLMAGLLEEGAGKLDSRAFARARDGLGARFGFGADADALSVSAAFLTENRDKAAALLHEALVAPRFDPAAIVRVKGQVLANIRAAKQDPNALAATKFYALAYPGHPYGSDDNGTVASVTALTRADIQAAYDATMGRNRIYVAAAGDITPKALGALLDKLFAGLPAKGAPLAGRASDRLTGGVTVVPFDTPQAAILFGEEGLRRKDPDFLAAYVLNEILGGGRFSARLMQALRVKRGLTYGVGTYLAPMADGQLLLGQVATDNAKVGAVIAGIRKVWTSMAEKGVTEAELAAAKTYLTGAFPLRFDGNGAIANILVGMQMDKIPMSYLKTRNAQVEALTVADLDRVAKRLLKPDNLRFVVVGRPQGLTPKP